MEFKIISAIKGNYNTPTRVEAVHVTSGEEYVYDSMGFSDRLSIYNHLEWCYNYRHKAKDKGDKWLESGDILDDPRKRRLIEAVMMNGNKHIVSELNEIKDSNSTIERLINEKSVMTEEDKVIMISNVEYFHSVKRV